MGACGCGDFHGEYQFPGPGDVVYAIGLYPSCKYCDTPAGVTLYRFDNGDHEMFDVQHIPPMEFTDYGAAFINVLGRDHLRSVIMGVLEGHKPDLGTIDNAEADVLTDEILDQLPSIVRATARSD